MKPGQDAIYFITGDNVDAVAKSPQLEGFRAKGVEVLLLTDPVDEFWLPAPRRIQGQAVPVGDARRADLDKIERPRTDEGRKHEPNADAIAA